MKYIFLAQAPPTASPAPAATPTPAAPTPSGFSADALVAEITKIYPALVGIASAIAIIMLIYAGILYTSSQGNPEGINKAKDVIFSTLAGYVLLLVAGYLITLIGG